MQGPSHVGFALAGAVTVNSLVEFFFPRPFNGAIDAVVHAIGTPVSYPLFLSWLHGHVSFDPVSFIHKATFYLVLIWCARLPDQLERRPAGEPNLKHRGFTHSCCMVIIMCWLIGIAVVAASVWLASKHILLSTPIVEEFWAGILGVILAIVLHIVADSLTTRKVPMMWPDETPVGLGLFSNKTPGEYIVLWSYIFLTGALVALGVVGF